MEEKNKKPHLIINFDINKTILLADKSKNFNVEKGVRSCIVDYAWGLYDESSKKWTLTEKNLSHKKPKDNLINYYDYMQKIHPMKKEHEIPDIDERFKKNQELQKLKNNLSLEFVNKNQPGEQLHDIYLDILNKLKIPKNIMDEIQKDNSKYSKLYKSLFQDGYIYLFHSLFQFIIDLQKQNRAYTLVFRTFGQDFNEVVQEYNSFCKGMHPIYPDIYFDGTHNSKDYRIKDNNRGLFYRFDDDINNLFLVIGTFKRYQVKTPDELYSKYQDEVNQGKVSIIKGGKNIFEFVTNSSVEGKFNSFCLNDHYETWYKHGKKSRYGKPMLVDPDNKNVDVYFFDDNIDKTETSIVDCRNVVNGEVITDKEFRSKFLIIADTIKAAVDESYYINKVI